MITDKKNRLRILHFDNLSQNENIIHFVSTRLGGFSEPPYDSLNIGFASGDNPIQVIRNRELLAETLDINADNFVFCRQVHDIKVRIVTMADLENDRSSVIPPQVEADAMVTDIPNFCLCVAVADCVPILLHDPVKKIIAAVHAGWKGTVKKIALNTVNAMSSSFDCNPENIIAGIGPSIGPEYYEIGEDVIGKVDHAFGAKAGNVLNHKKDGSTYLDLWQANKMTLVEAGLTDENIEIAGLCTYDNPELFYSYRRDGKRCGRLAAGIILR